MGRYSAHGSPQLSTKCNYFPNDYYYHYFNHFTTGESTVNILDVFGLRSIKICVRFVFCRLIMRTSVLVWTNLTICLHIYLVRIKFFLFSLHMSTEFFNIINVGYVFFNRYAFWFSKLLTNYGLESTIFYCFLELSLYSW